MDTTRHRRFLEEQLADPEFRAEYERASAEIAQVDEVMAALDRLRLQARLLRRAFAPFGARVQR